MASFKQTASKCIKDLVNYEKYEKTVKENREILYEAFFEEVGLTTLEEKIGALRFIEGKLKDGTIKESYECPVKCLLKKLPNRAHVAAKK